MQEHESMHKLVKQYKHMIKMADASPRTPHSLRRYKWLLDPESHHRYFVFDCSPQAVINQRLKHVQCFEEFFLLRYNYT